MLQLCGDNEYTQLGISSNDKNIKWYPIVSPPANSHLDISSLLSNSVYNNHSVWITHHCKAHAIGLNHGCRICSSSKDKFKKETRIIIKDSNGNSVKILSAVCGEHYSASQGQPNRRFLSIVNRHRIVLINVSFAPRIKRSLRWAIASTIFNENWQKNTLTTRKTWQKSRNLRKISKRQEKTNLRFWSLLKLPSIRRWKELAIAKPPKYIKWIVKKFLYWR